MKTPLARLARWSLAFLLPLLAAGLSHAQATRTWVSGVGDDANPCSRTAPCKTFAGAISRTAAGGEISVLDPGGFGAVTITKAITLSGDGTLASILAIGTNGINVSAGANDVVILRNLSLQGAGGGIHGIRFSSGLELHVENVTVDGFLGAGLLFQPSAWSALHVTRFTGRNNFNAGIYVQPAAGGSATATIGDSALDGNGHGLRVEAGGSVVARNVRAGGNDVNGFTVSTASATPAFLTLDNASASGSSVGLMADGAQAWARLGNTLLTRNRVGMDRANNGNVISLGGNRVSGNNEANNASGTPTATEGTL